MRTLLAEAWSQFEAASADIAANGPIHETANGYRYSNPAVNQCKEAAKLIAKLTESLGDGAVPAPGAKPAVFSRKR